MPQWVHMSLRIGITKHIVNVAISIVVYRNVDLYFLCFVANF